MILSELCDHLRVSLVELQVERALEQGRASGEFGFEEAPSAIAQVLTAVYFDVQGRWLEPVDPPFDLAAELRSRVRVVLRALRPERSRAMGRKEEL